MTSCRELWPLHPSGLRNGKIKAALQQVNRLNPTQLKGTLDYPGDAIHLIIEFDDGKEAAQKKGY